MIRKTKMYCHRCKRPSGEIWYAHFQTRPEITRLYDKSANVLEALVTETSDTKKAYWAWWDSKEKEFEFVYPEKFLVDMCFPYGTKPETEKGGGYLLPVSIEILTPRKSRKAR